MEINSLYEMSFANINLESKNQSSKLFLYVKMEKVDKVNKVPIKEIR